MVKKSPFILFVLLSTIGLSQSKHKITLSTKANDEFNQVVSYEWNYASNRDVFRGSIFNQIRFYGKSDLESVYETIQTMRVNRTNRDIILKCLNASSRQYGISMYSALVSWGMEQSVAREVTFYTNELIKNDELTSDTITRNDRTEPSFKITTFKIFKLITVDADNSAINKNVRLIIKTLDPIRLSVDTVSAYQIQDSVMVKSISNNKILRYKKLLFEKKEIQKNFTSYRFKISNPDNEGDANILTIRIFSKPQKNSARFYKYSFDFSTEDANGASESSFIYLGNK